MQEETYAVVAYIAGRLILQVQSTGLYDVGRSRNVPLSGTVSTSTVSVYDADRVCTVSGESVDGETFSLFEGGSGATLSLVINHSNSTFTGYDTSSQQHFLGNVNNKTVNVSVAGMPSGYTFQFGSTTPNPVSAPQAAPAPTVTGSDPHAMPASDAENIAPQTDDLSGLDENQQSSDSASSSAS